MAFFCSECYKKRINLTNFLQKFHFVPQKTSNGSRKKNDRKMLQTPIIKLNYSTGTTLPTQKEVDFERIFGYFRSFHFKFPSLKLRNHDLKQL